MSIESQFAEDAGLPPSPSDPGGINPPSNPAPGSLNPITFRVRGNAAEARAQLATIPDPKERAAALAAFDSTAAPAPSVAAAPVSDQGGQDGSYDAYLKAYDAAPDHASRIQTGLDYAASLKANPSASHLLAQFDADAASPAPAAASTSPGAAQTYSPTGTATDNALAGAGKAVSDTGLGVKQLLDIPAQWLESKFPGVSKWAESQGMPSAASSAAATNQEVADSRQRDAPLMGTGAGVAGNIAGNVAMTLLPATGLAKAGVPGAAALVNPATYASAAGAGAVQGALQPTTDDESKVRNALVGGAAGAVGNAAVNAIGRVAQPTAQLFSVAHAKAVQTLQDAGVPLDAAQRSGSAFLNKVRSSLSDNPFTAGAQADLQATQQAAYNKAVLGTIGENATAATPDVMSAASNRINGVFADTLGRTQVNATNDFPFLNRLTDIQKGALAAEKTPVSNYVNRIIGSADQNGQIPGQVAYGIKKELDNMSNTNDSTANYWARSLNSALKDQMSASMTPADAQAFNEARAQFAKMKTIEPAIDRVGGGDISAAKLANTLATKQNRQFSVYGRGDSDLVDLAQSGNMLLKDKAPNSGTAGRLAMQLGIGAVGGGALGASTGDSSDAVRNAAIGAGGMIALPKMMQRAMNSPAASGYLANGVRGPLRDLMLAPQTQPLVGGALRRIAAPANSARLSDLMQQDSP